MTDARRIISRLASDCAISAADFRTLLSDSLAPSDAAILAATARECADAAFGRKVRIRGLLEITNVCRNNCLYCGLRRENRALSRYTLTDREILNACEKAFEAGFRTFVLQGGENPALSADYVAGIVRLLRKTFPEAAITLSLGEWPDEAFRMFREDGADRYLLRHETHNASHYAALHPAEMSRENRLRCLHTLKRLGFQTGTGIMVGSPGQTIEHIIEDIEFMRELQPEMIGIGPFIPHCATPFADCNAGSIGLTLRLISILRMLFPNANIPATTALATLRPDGRNLGIEAGANVVMPNITPPIYRGDYQLYDNKAASGAEAAEGLKLLEADLGRIGMEITTERGDFETHKPTCSILNQT